MKKISEAAAPQKTKKGTSQTSSLTVKEETSEDRTGKDEMNLVEHPFALLSKRGWARDY